MQSRAIPFGLGTLVGLGSAIGLTRWKTREENTRLLEQDTVAENEKPTMLLKYGYPEHHISTHTYTAHTLTYDRCRRIPLWVAEVISRDMVTSKVANRKRSQFQPDPAVPTNFSSCNDDYRRSGWSRGHMAPAGNYKHCQKSMDDTFYLTNILPQDFDNNSGYWNRLEQYCRDLTSRFGEVSIISGPLFLPEKDEKTGKSYVKYEVLGEGCVSVPTHMFKVILVEDSQSSSNGSTTPVLGAFVIPNQPIKNVDLTQFQVSLEKLESYTGTTFYSKLDRSMVKDLCTVHSCKLMSLSKMLFNSYNKRMHSAQSLKQLDGLMEEMKKRGLDELIEDDKFKQLYRKRKAELE